MIDSPHDKAVNDAFVQQLTTALAAQQPHAMLTPNMRQTCDAGVIHMLAAGAKPLTQEPGNTEAPRPFLAQVNAMSFIAKSTLREELFGPSCLIVRAESLAETLDVLQAVGGSLTVTLWGTENECDVTRSLVRGAMAIAGRVLFTGVPTGVAVTTAQQHGGPWPSSTQPMTTSVGDAAMDRFLRPVALQDAPDWLLIRKGQPC